MTNMTLLQDKSANISPKMNKILKSALIGVLIASATALQLIESPLPRIVPWLKPGLANSLTLFAIVKLGSKEAIIVAALRTIVTSVFLGSLLSPIFFTSFAGSFSAAICMSILNNTIGSSHLVIISILGAIASNVAQLAVVQYMFTTSLPFFLYLALIIWVAIPSGFVVAKLTQELIRRIKI